MTMPEFSTSTQVHVLKGFMQEPESEMQLVLASRSPRREQILKMLGMDFRTVIPDYEEIIPAGVSPALVPEILAKGKAMSLADLGPDTLVLGSDTIVLLENRILGKPEDASHAYEMLSALNGRTHTVVTGVALACQGKILASGSESTRVTFAQASDKAIRAYANSQEPLDKAGAYAIQGHGARLVDSVQGCFYNVMGLPIQLTLRMLRPHAIGEK